MQNIKVCPKCNQVAPKSNNAFCPYDGTALVEMQPKQNQQWQQPPAIHPQAASTPLTASPKKKMNPLMIGCLALIGVPIIIFVAMSAAFYSGFSGKGSGTETNTIKISAPNEIETRRTSNSSTASPSTSTSKEKLEGKEKALSPRQKLEEELENLEGEDAGLDKKLDMFEDYDGPQTTRIKLDALKRKAQIELRRIELERKLKKMPR